MQFSVIRTRCATRFRDTAFSIVTDAEWKDYVNARYRKVQAASPYWPFEESALTSLTAFAAGDRKKPLPTNVVRVTAVWDSTHGTPLVPLEGRSDFLHLYPSQTETGPPQHYRIHDGNLYLYPLPDTAVTIQIEAFQDLTDLTSDADLPTFPAQFHDILVEGALADAYLDDGAQDQFKQHDDRFSGILNDMLQDQLQPKQERYYQIVDTWGD